MKQFRLIGCCLATVLLMVGLLGSCAGGPRIQEPSMSVEYRPEILDDMYHQARDVPEWVFLEVGELEDDDAEDYLFKFIESGKNLDGLKLWSRGFSASSEIARMVSTEVRTTFAGAAAGDKDMLETYIEEAVKSISKAQYSGARKQGEYWWKVRKTEADGTIEDVYEYFLLYAVPREQIDAAIRRSLDEADAKLKPKNEEEETARKRVKEAFSGEE